MRDKASPETIRGLLTTLQELWSKYPEQRLGQLLLNLSGADDLWNLDEQALHERARAVLKEGWTPGCDHGIVFDPEVCDRENLDAHEIRRRFPRLDGECLKCGYTGIYYASMQHCVYGDW